MNNGCYYDSNFVEIIVDVRYFVNGFGSFLSLGHPEFISGSFGMAINSGVNAASF